MRGPTGVSHPGTSLFNVSRTLSSALEQTNEKLRVISDRIENTGFMRSDDRKVVSELVDEIRAAIADRKVSNKATRASDLDC